MPNTQPLKTGDPQRLGDYELSGRLGEGGQGVVFLGMRGGESYAVKLLHGPVGDERAAFLREVELAKHVARFCTAQVIDAGFEDGLPYIVSEYVDGPSLHREVALTGPRRGGALERLAVGTATALAAIHRAGIVHRDFKPQNVLLGPDGPRVIDFGLARALDAAATVSGRGVGTPAYMAPEQITASAVTGAVDVFSWGATMCFAANASAPFGQDSVAPVLHRILTAPPELGLLDGQLRGLVEACLEKDSRNRPSSRDLLLALLGDTEDVPAEVLRSPPPHILRVDPVPMAEPEATGAASAAYHLAGSVAAASRERGTPSHGVPAPRDPLGSGNGNGWWRGAETRLGEEPRKAGSAVNRAGLAVSGALLISAAVLATVLVPALRNGSAPPPQAAVRTTVTTSAVQAVDPTIPPTKAKPTQQKEERPRPSTVAGSPPAVPAGVTVPGVTGMDRSQAVKALKRAGFAVGTITQIDSAQKIGQVLGSRPAAGTSAARGSTVSLQVSAGLEVPSVTGMRRKAAEAALAGAGLAAGDVTRQCSPQPDGQVLATRPGAGARVLGGTKVALVVARNGLRVPGVVGLTRTAAQAGLRGAGFDVSFRAQVVDNQSDVDRVLAQSVAAGSCGDPGQTVVITVGVEGQTGPDPGESPTETPGPPGDGPT